MRYKFRDLSINELPAFAFQKKYFTYSDILEDNVIKQVYAFANIEVISYVKVYI